MTARSPPADRAAPPSFFGRPPPSECAACTPPCTSAAAASPPPARPPPLPPPRLARPWGHPVSPSSVISGVGTVSVILAQRGPPLAPELQRQVVVEPAREREHEGHDVRADVVVVDLAEVGDHRRVRDQLVVIVAGGRRSLRGLEPAEPAGLA